MRGDAEVSDVWVGGQHDVERRRLSASARSLVKHVGDSVCRERVAPERVGDGLLEVGSAVVVEQLAKAKRVRRQPLAATREGVEEWRRRRARLAEPVSTAQVAGAPL